MSDFEFSEEKILRSWQRNAAPWIRAIDSASIASRKLVTDQAIVDAALEYQPASLLDIGCGEGWLARRLAASGVEVMGVDAVPELIERARRQAGTREDYRLLTYEDLVAGKLARRFDALVCNFSLLGEQSVDNLVPAARDLLNPGGHLLIQTLHPLIANGDGIYRDGWRAGSWDGFSDDFSDPAPWYFRTLGSWLQLLRDSGLQLVDLREPVHPQTGVPASLIMVASG